MLSTEPLLDELGNIFKGVSLIKDLSVKTLDTIVSYGERLSSLIVSRVIDGAEHYDSRRFIKTQMQCGKHIVDFEETNRLVKAGFNPLPRIAVVPGFIASERAMAMSPIWGVGDRIIRQLSWLPLSMPRSSKSGPMSMAS